MLRVQVPFPAPPPNHIYVNTMTIEYYLYITTYAPKGHKAMHDFRKIFANSPDEALGFVASEAHPFGIKSVSLLNENNEIIMVYDMNKNNNDKNLNENNEQVSDNNMMLNEYDYSVSKNYSEKLEEKEVIGTKYLKKEKYKDKSKNKLTK